MIPPLPTEPDTYKNFLQDSYVSGIITSFAVMAAIEFWNFCKRVFVKRRFKAIFSKKNSQLSLIVPGFTVRPDFTGLAAANHLPCPQHPLTKIPGVFHSSSKLIGNSDVKSLKYLSDEISNRLNYSPRLRLDDELVHNLDLDFIAFGGSNFYFRQMINSQENTFFSYDLESIRSKVTGTVYLSNPNYDYGLVMKLKNYNFPDRVWIAVAGTDESGTSGSGWYLSKYWKKIQNGAGSSEFALLIEVQQGVDHTAHVIEAYYRPGTIDYKLYI